MSSPVFRQVFVVNLARRPERLSSVMSQLTHSGITAANGYDVRRFEAIDGSKLNSDVLVRRGFLSRLGKMRLDEPLANKIWGMDLNAGGLGCAMSHILLWSQFAAMSTRRQHAVEGGSMMKAENTVAVNLPQPPPEGVLVVEDDSLFPSDGTFLAQLTDRMHHAPVDWQFVYVGGLDTGGVASRLQVAPGISRVPQLHRTTNCYLIRPDGARQLLDRCVPFTYQIDTQMTAEVTTSEGPGGGGASVPYGVAVDQYFTLQPPLVTQACGELFASDIQGVAR